LGSILIVACHGYEQIGLVRLQAFFGSRSIAKVERVQDELGDRSQVSVTGFVPEDELGTKYNFSYNVNI